MEDGRSPQPSPGTPPVWTGLAVLLMANIYLLAWVGRPLVKFLVDHGALKPMVAVAGFAGALLLLFAARMLPGASLARAILAIAVFAISETLSLYITRTAPESIHTIEYELLAFFIFQALKGRREGWRLYMTTMALILIAGWSDEAMQSFVPDRYYDPMDVLLNLVSGGFGLIIAVILSGGKGRGGGMRIAQLFAAVYFAIAFSSCAHQAGGLKLHFIDVGEGDAALLEWRGEKPAWILVDTGNPVTGHKALEYVRKQGVRELDAIIITHPHMDHAGGLFQIAQSIPVRALYDNGEDPWKDGDQNVFYRWYGEFCHSHPIHKTLKAGDKIALGDAVLEVLWPPEERFESQFVNARSLVMMLRHGRFRALLAGDLIIPAERALVWSGADLSAKVLKAGHHGAEDTGSPEFLGKVRPETIVISVNKDNANGYPSKETLERMTATGARILRTDIEGDITIDNVHPRTQASTGDAGKNGCWW